MHTAPHMAKRQLGAGAQVRQTVEVISGKAQPFLQRRSPQMQQWGDGLDHGAVSVTSLGGLSLAALDCWGGC